MKIFLVRHGMDEEGFRGGWSNRGLIDQGVLQSRKLGEDLYRHPEQYGIHTILSSDLARAVETTREKLNKFSKSRPFTQKNGEK